MNAMSTPAKADQKASNNKKPCAVCGSPTCKCVNCNCTEEFCCSMASSVIQSLGGGAPTTVTNNSRTLKKRTTTASSTAPVDPLAPIANSLQSPKNSDRDDDGGGIGSGDDDCNLEEAELVVEGMTCMSCARTIKESVQNLGKKSIRSVVVNLGTETAIVKWKNETTGSDGTTTSDLITPSRIQDAIEAVGYTVTDVHILRQAKEKPTVKVADILVSGMTCSMCAQAIENAVGNLDGVQEVRVVLATDTVHVTWDPHQRWIENIKETIEDIGYEIEGVEYPSENRKKKKADTAGLVASSGKAAADQNGTSDFEEDEENHGAPEEEEVSMDERWQRLTRRQEEKVQKKRAAFLWSLVGTVPVLLLTMVLNHFIHRGFLYRHIHLGRRTLQVESILLWMLATPVQFLAGWDFYKMAYYNLRSGRPGMDVLVALGTTAAYVYAIVGALRGDDMSAHFFETSVVLISFVLAGKWLQTLAVRRTSEALTRLMQLQSKTALKITPLTGSLSEASFDPRTDPFTEAVVPIREVQKGDFIKVIRGSSIPADGRVVFGAMSVDESMVTGESMPVLKTLGSDVLGGTICVESEDSGEGSGPAFVAVTGVGSSTALAQIIQLVQDAQTRSVPIQTFADTVSAIFVPIVCLISLLTYMTWYALCQTKVVPPSWYQDLGEDPATFSLMFGIACLVISCPCALGLATPTAVMVGTGVGAKVGVLMKGGEALEVASKVDSVIFDKTGTLTRGKPAITDFIRIDTNVDLSDEYLMWLLGCCERQSEHPLAKAVVSYVEAKLPTDYLNKRPFVEPSQFRAMTGRGASAVVADRVKIAVGNRSFALENNLVVPRAAEEAMQEIEYLGKTAILVAVDEGVCLVLGLADELKPGAKDSITHLRDVMHVDVWMVTGDNARTARAIATQLGLAPERVIAEALPAAKVQQVRKLQEEDHLVAMIGDGINDSPALAQADVGISVGTAVEIAAEASDMVLVKGDVVDVCTALDLSRCIFRRIQLNLLWSLLYNVLGIPVAAGVFYPFIQRRLPPTVAALAMALSSVSVVLSSLSLRLYTPPEVARRSMNRSRMHQGWSRQDHTDSGDLHQYLLANDFLSSSEVTESTAIIDNRSPGRKQEDNAGNM